MNGTTPTCSVDYTGTAKDKTFIDECGPHTVVDLNEEDENPATEIIEVVKPVRQNYLNNASFVFATLFYLNQKWIPTKRFKSTCTIWRYSPAKNIKLLEQCTLWSENEKRIILFMSFLTFCMNQTFPFPYTDGTFAIEHVNIVYGLRNDLTYFKCNIFYIYNRYCFSKIIQFTYFRLSR